MYQVKFQTIIIVLLYLATPLNLHAAADIKPPDKESKNVVKKKSYSKNNIKIKKKKWFNAVFKKKRIGTSDDPSSRINKNSKIALIFGIISFSGWAIGLFVLTSIFSFTAGFGIGIVISLIGLIGGLTAAGSTLKEIKNSPNNDQYNREKRRAKWGLILSLATTGALLLFLIAALSI